MKIREQIKQHGAQYYLESTCPEDLTNPDDRRAWMLGAAIGLIDHYSIALSNAEGIIKELENTSHEETI